MALRLPLERLKLLLGDATLEAAEKAATSSNVDTTKYASSDINHGEYSSAGLDLAPPPMNVDNDSASVKMASTLSTTVPERTDLSIGELAPPGTPFCPILSVNKFPYTHMQARSKDSERVSQGYFANGQFWERTWHL